MPAEASSLIMMVVLFGVMYFFMIRPQKKKDKEVKDMRNSLTIGDEVITIGGIHGKIVKVNDDVVTLEMPHAKQRITFSKWAIGTVNKKGKENKSEIKEEVIETTEINEIKDDENK